MNVRKLEASELKIISKLFEEHKDPGQAHQFWQHRTADFEKIYSHHQTGPSRCWGSFEGSRLQGSLCFVPTAVNTFGLPAQTDLITDLFIAPENQHTLRVGTLFQTCFEYYSHVVNSDQVTTFAIENKPGSFTGVTRYAKEFDYVCEFPFQTTAEQVFLTQNYAAVPHVEEINLKDLPPDLKNQWLVNYQKERRDCLFSPMVNDETLNKMTELDSKARLLFIQKGGELIAASCMLNWNAWRKLYWPKEDNLVRARVQRSSDVNLKPGMNMLLAHMSLSIETRAGQGHSLRSIFEQALHVAQREHFHVVNFRDELPASVKNLSADQLTFTRRVVSIHPQRWSLKNEVEHRLQQGRLFSRFEGAFL